jgi:hypothetical protein
MEFYCGNNLVFQISTDHLVRPSWSMFASLNDFVQTHTLKDYAITPQVTLDPTAGSPGLLVLGPREPLALVSKEHHTQLL